MKYLIALILLTFIIHASEALKKLEIAYFNKADRLQTNRDVIVNSADDKLKKESRKLAEIYLRSLKVLLKTETKKGDFDAAVAVKTKIVEIEKQLKEQITRPAVEPKAITYKKIKCAEWSPKIVGNAIAKTAVFDLKDFITGKGQYKITFTYVKGTYALVIDSVELLRTGIPISKDIHRGITGHKTSNNTYTLDIKFYTRSSYKLRTKLYGEDGIDSFGNIYIEKLK